MTQLQRQKIYVHQLKSGMYVSGLDRPWLETPFYLQGFMVRDGAEIQKLALYCDYVYIDQEKSIANFETSVAHKTGHNRKLGVAATPVAHSEAIMKLASWRKTLFQKDLVDTFIQAIGLYPLGSLVELTNGEVAVVSDFRPGMGRKPELTVILDREKKRLPRKKVLVLTGKEGTIDIAKNLPPDAYNLDPEALF